MMTKPKPPALIDTLPDAALTIAGGASIAPDKAAIPDPIVATDENGVERPLSGGCFVRIDGKLVRQEG